MDEAKIRLSAPEMELVKDAGWILTKNGILEKVNHLLGAIQQHYQGQLQQVSSLPAEVLASSPKISRGENYKGLPWLVLDYPRCFGQQDVFAIRTLFWWGHFFSITLQLSGSYKKSFEEKIIRAFESLAQSGFFICRSNNPWEHHFEEDNYCAVAKMDKHSFEELIRQRSFIKLAVRFPIPQWDEMTRILPGYFKQMIMIVADQLPRR